MTAYRLLLAREHYKFSVAHMTVFADGKKERLHGHNYRVEVALDLADVAMENLVPFSRLKGALAELCAAWRERTIIAERNPYLVVVRRDDDEVELTLCGRRYVLPAEDVLFLPVDNASVEQLAGLVADRLCAALRDHLDPAVVGALEVTLYESPGQGAAARRGLWE